MDKLEQGYLDGFIKAAAPLGNMAQDAFKYVQPTLGEFKESQRLSNPMALATRPDNTRFSGGPNILKNLFNKAKGPVVDGAKSMGEGISNGYDWLKANPIKGGIGLSAGAALGGSTAGALTSGIPSKPDDLAQRVNAAAQGGAIDPKSIYEMIKKHLSEHKAAYGVGGGALALGGLGYYMNNHKNKHRVADTQIPFSSGQDEPGVENVE